MKKLLIIAILFYNVDLFAQVKVAKITKVENLVAKDEYGNVKQNFLKLKLTLSSGQTEIYERKLLVKEYEGTETWRYLGLNKSKNAFILLKHWDNGGYDNHYEVRFYEFRFNAKSKKYKLERLEYGPNEAGVFKESGCCFKISDGWEFGSLVDNEVIMIKDGGYEWYIQDDLKTNGIRYLKVFEGGRD